MIPMGRLMISSKGVSFSNFRHNYERIGISQVEMHERVGKSLI